MKRKLDQLMGRNRNLPLDQLPEPENYYDPDVSS